MEATVAESARGRAQQAATDEARTSYVTKVARLKKLAAEVDGAFVLDTPAGQHVRAMTWLTCVRYDHEQALELVRTWLEEWHTYRLDIGAQLSVAPDGREAWVLTLTAFGVVAEAVAS